MTMRHSLDLLLLVLSHSLIEKIWVNVHKQLESVIHHPMYCSETQLVIKKNVLYGRRE